MLIIFAILVLSFLILIHEVGHFLAAKLVGVWPEEFGIGMNPASKIIGNVLEDEKKLGTVHVAFGDNSTFGGNVKCGIHIDGIILKPTVVINDEKTILEKGELTV